MRGNACTNPPPPALPRPTPLHPTPCLLLLTANPLTLPPVHAHASALSSPHRPHQRLTWSALSTLPVCHVLPTPYTCRRRQVRSCNPPPHRYTNHVGRHAVTNQARQQRCSRVSQDRESDRTEILGGGQTGREKQVEEIDRAGRAGSGDFNINDSSPLRSLFPPRYTALSKLLPPLTDFP